LIPKKKNYENLNRKIFSKKKNGNSRIIKEKGGHLLPGTKRYLRLSFLPDITDVIVKESEKSSCMSLPKSRSDHLCIFKRLKCFGNDI